MSKKSELWDIISEIWKVRIARYKPRKTREKAELKNINSENEEKLRIARYKLIDRIKKNLNCDI